MNYLNLIQNKMKQLNFDKKTVVILIVGFIGIVLLFFSEMFFQEDDVETIAGLVVKLLGKIAEVGDTASSHNLTFTVKEIDGARITKLEILKEENLAQDVELFLMASEKSCNKKDKRNNQDRNA